MDVVTGAFTCQIKKAKGSCKECRGNKPCAVFEKMYQTGVWSKDQTGGGSSGTGSDPRNAKPLIVKM
jgi:hypothetical protein